MALCEFKRPMAQEPEAARTGDMNEDDRIARNLEAVRRRMGEAARRAGRKEGDARLVAVTKAVGEAEVRALFRLGAKDFGENRVADAEPKIAALAGEPVRWHMIGHLQRNKVRRVVGRYCLVHSVDSERLLAEIASCAASRGMAQDVLLQVNVSGEESKFGMAPEALGDVLRLAGETEGVRVAGLMTMAPLEGDPEASRPVFRALRELRDRFAAPGDPRLPMTELSMGMTQDYEVAIEEGATLVRVGSALFR